MQENSNADQVLSDIVYKNIVSVGYNCGAAYQIKLHTRNAENHFFDWLYTSCRSASVLIENDFSGFMLKDNLEIVRDSREVFDHGSGIRFNHSFKTNGLVDPEKLNADYHRERSKFIHLAEKFRAILSSSESVAYIRYNPIPDMLDRQADLERLVRAIKRTASGPFTVFWLTRGAANSPSEALSENLVRVHLVEDQSRSTSFEGRDFIGTDDVAWGNFLGSLKFTPPTRILASGAPIFPIEPERPRLSVVP